MVVSLCLVNVKDEVVYINNKILVKVIHSKEVIVIILGLILITEVIQQANQSEIHF